MPRRDFKYPIGDRKLVLSKRAAEAGERAFNRPADINDRVRCEHGEWRVWCKECKDA
jgi:hypothetical protein